MIGVICSGRPVQVAEQIEPTKFVVNLENAGNVKYITLFLLPNTEFVDPAFTALIYFQLPNSEEFKLLGGINPLKPSAIYRIKGLTSNSNSQFGEVNDVAMDESEANPTVVRIGILIEPTLQAEATLAASKASQIIAYSNENITPQPPTALSTITTESIANKIIKSALNHILGFVDSKGNVPFTAFESWWNKFRLRMASDPEYLDKITD